MNTGWYYENNNQKKHLWKGHADAQDQTPGSYAACLSDPGSDPDPVLWPRAEGGGTEIHSRANQKQNYKSTKLADSVNNGVRKFFSTIKEEYGVKIKPQRHREHKKQKQEGLWSKIRCLRLGVRTSDFRSDNAGSIPAGITIWSIGVMVNISACHAEDAGSNPVCSSKKYGTFI